MMNCSNQLLQLLNLLDSQKMCVPLVVQQIERMNTVCQKENRSDVSIIKEELLDRMDSDVYDNFKTDQYSDRNVYIAQTAIFRCWPTIHYYTFQSLNWRHKLYYSLSNTVENTLKHIFLYKYER